MCEGKPGKCCTAGDADPSIRRQHSVDSAVLSAIKGGQRTITLALTSGSEPDGNVALDKALRVTLLSEGLYFTCRPL